MDYADSITFDAEKVLERELNNIEGQRTCPRETDGGIHRANGGRRRLFEIKIKQSS